jgi:hypothetical protein
MASIPIAQALRMITDSQTIGYRPFGFSIIGGPRRCAQLKAMQRKKQQIQAERRCAGGIALC